MGENTGIIGWIRQRFGKLKNDTVSYSTCRNNQSSGHSVNSNGPFMDVVSLCSAKSSSVLSGSATDMGFMTAVCTTVPPSCCTAQPSCSQRFGCSHTSSTSCPESSGHSLPPSLRSPFRFSHKYDVYVCHSDENISQALALVSFLESPSRGLRCYLQPRDCPLGGAVPTEFCRAVQTSHCWVLLITPNFLKDEWCLYQMQQAICEGPMSQRIIPTVLDLQVSEIPRELCFFFSVDLNSNREAGYTQVYKTVLHYLKEMCRKEEFHVPPSCSHTECHVEMDYSETAQNNTDNVLN
ncbi:toll/interleukin-1 receptor domain-containing adapter protein isoform X2 [Brachyhypopomus gauderio]|uniref:toll/interleukin-1 receptor domain-containing adapter protein isoform X2 n=1 Tax=Brachyhypopomus gauderio TaxID=698409 RepID=UPI0040417180